MEWPTTTGRSKPSDRSSRQIRSATLSSGAGSPPLSPCADRSMAMLVTAPSSWSMIGRHVRRSKVSPCRKTTGVPVPSMS
jgi:hypothetical protein